MHPALAAAITAAHHAPAQHTAGYWLTGIVISLAVGLAMALLRRSA